jgi:hypothetical protein
VRHDWHRWVSLTAGMPGCFLHIACGRSLGMGVRLLIVGVLSSPTRSFP